jgi:hypothetical protein
LRVFNRFVATARREGGADHGNGHPLSLHFVPLVIRGSSRIGPAWVGARP